MSSRLAKLLSLRAMVNEMILEFDSENIAPIDSGTDDPMTSPLHADGSWTPPLLARLAGAAAALYPDGYLPESADGQGGRIRSPARWPAALYFDGCLGRKDLTEKQRDTLQSTNRLALMLAMTDGGYSLAFTMLDPDATPPTGGYVAVLSMIYNDKLDRLRRDLRRHYAEFLSSAIFLSTVIA